MVRGDEHTPFNREIRRFGVFYINIVKMIFYVTRAC